MYVVRALIITVVAEVARLSKRVFVLGPSHHVYLDGCALTRCTEYETPLGVLPIDTESRHEAS